MTGPQDSHISQDSLFADSQDFLPADPHGSLSAPRTHVSRKFDVALLGGHLAASLLGAVLAKHGVRVLLVDTESDTAEPAGETTVPYTAEIFFTLARRFDLPEIAAFGLTCDLPAEIQRTSGVKRSLGFLHHTPGEPQVPAHTTQINVPGEHSEWHVYRPHVDQYAHRVARDYGAVVMPHRPLLKDVTPSDDGVEILLSDGTVCHARYVVDGSGLGSPLVRKLAAADAEPRLLHRSRVVTTHMSGVVPFEDTVDIARYGNVTPFSKGTISHLFDGGWIQVAHFDNRAEPANPYASVTLSVCPRRHRDLPSDPEAAFRTVVGRFPSLERSFSGAIAVKPWDSAERWQHTVGATVGERYFLYDRTASRNDMFLSRDVTMSAEMVHALAPALIEAARADDWSPRRFEPAARLQRELAEFNDRLLVSARTATRDFRLWNAYSRVWLLWSMLAALALKSTRNQALANGDWSTVERFDDGPFWFELPKGLPRMLDDLFRTTEAVERGALSPERAADEIFARLRKAPFVPPLYRFADPKARYYHFSLGKRLKVLLWSKTLAPPEFRRMLTKENVTNVPPAAVH